MRFGIIGLPGSGKSTVFRALSGGVDLPEHKSLVEPALGVVTVDDARLQFLADHYKTKKITPVHVEYMDFPAFSTEGKAGRGIGDRLLTHIRPVDAVIQCLRFFDSPALGPAEPLQDLDLVEEDLILSDLGVVEKRLERVAKDIKKGRKELADEAALLEQARSILDQGKPLRIFPPAAESELLRGFAFLSAKPTLFLLNAGEEKSHSEIEAAARAVRARVADQPNTSVDWLYADNEAEIARLDPEDAAEFLKELHLERGAKERIVRTSFDLLKLIVFFTAGEKEVRAWPLKEGENALDAAGTVHSDMKRGFIRAEVVAFEDFRQAGSLSEAQKAGKTRLEGKEYRVRDGDVILFRFNV
ncbi:MAG: YchF family ATPase [Desulfomonile sp.]|nr:YchF family ATPase [Desulfomonile sp.]